MPYIRLLGGLGNQLFQLAAGQFVEHHHGLRVTYDRSWYSHPTLGDSPRQLEVPVELTGQRCFRIPRMLGKVAYSHRNPLFMVERGPQDDLLARSLHRHSFLHGYFQFAKYPLAVQEELWRILETPLGLAKATKAEGVALHVRLGDYYHDRHTRRHHGVLPPEYFARALHRLKAEGVHGRVVAFTDSPDIFEAEYLPVLGEDIIVADVDGAWGVMASMAACRAIVMSNSSLSWWAAFIATQLLKRDAVVIRPEPWFRLPSAADDNLGLPEWHSLERVG